MPWTLMKMFGNRASSIAFLNIVYGGCGPGPLAGKAAPSPPPAMCSRMIGSPGNAATSSLKSSDAVSSTRPMLLTTSPSSAALRQMASGSGAGERCVGFKRMPTAPRAAYFSSFSGASGRVTSTITTTANLPGNLSTHSKRYSWSYPPVWGLPCCMSTAFSTLFRFI